MITIYVDDKPLRLVERNEETKGAKDADGVITKFGPDIHSPESLVAELEQPEIQEIIIIDENITAFFERLKSGLKVIIAAGGLVYTPQHDLLLIHRLGKWDLPKGKLDEGESIEECAVREIEEETGAKHITLEAPLTVTYHTYRQKGKTVLKESHWFLVKADSKSELIPQTEENITESIWVPLAQIDEYIQGAFASIADVLTAGVESLKELK